MSKKQDEILILKGNDVLQLLQGREQEVIDAVAAAYVTHGAGQSSLPHSTFLRFPDEPRNRIIALPAYLGDGYEIAGLKWIASFPGNLEHGIDRASAVIILNSAQTGRPRAIIEGSIVSARRTAASAALAARTLRVGEAIAKVGLVGCGVINFEIVRFLRAVWPQIDSLIVYDNQPGNGAMFVERCRKDFDGLTVTLAPTIDKVLGSAELITFATTAATPHVADLSVCRPGTVVLHVSLRDVTPDAAIACDNVVDDVDHVCRAQTSLHLAEQLVGNRDFVRCTLADVLRGVAPARENAKKVILFSPFGLGILDLAVSKLVYDLAIEQGVGITIDSFLPEPWRVEGAKGNRA